jgi:UDP-glucose 4-epimerase
MKCLVTGGAGFIGSNLVDELLKRGHDVVVTDNKSANSNECFYWTTHAKNYSSDITNYGAMSDIFEREEPSHVFHLAAEARIQPTITDPPKSLRTNIEGTANLLKLSNKHGVERFLLSSTSAVYGLKNEVPFNEEMPRQCLNPYSISKACGEDLCKFYYKVYGLKTIIFRYFNVYGPRQPVRGQYAPVIGLFLTQKKSNKLLTVIGDGTQTRDFTHVNDVVAANMLGATSQNKEIYGEVFNVGTGKALSILNLAEMVDGEMEFLPPRDAELSHAQADITKIKKLLQWEPKMNLEDWINDNNL